MTQIEIEKNHNWIYLVIEFRHKQFLWMTIVKKDRKVYVFLTDKNMDKDFKDENSYLFVEY